MRVNLLAHGRNYNFDCEDVCLAEGSVTAEKISSNRPITFKIRWEEVSITSIQPDSISITSNVSLPITLYTIKDEISFGIQYRDASSPNNRFYTIMRFIFRCNQEMLSSLRMIPHTFPFLDDGLSGKFFFLRFLALIEDYINFKFYFEVSGNTLIICKCYTLIIVTRKFYGELWCIYTSKPYTEIKISYDEFTSPAKDLARIISKKIYNCDFKNEKRSIERCYDFLKIEEEGDYPPLPLLLLRSVVLEETYRLHRKWRCSPFSLDPIPSNHRVNYTTHCVNILFDSDQNYGKNYTSGEIELKNNKIFGVYRMLKAVSEYKISTVILPGGFTLRGDTRRCEWWSCWCTPTLNEELDYFVEKFYIPIKNKVGDVLLTVEDPLPPSDGGRRRSNINISNHSGDHYHYYHFQKDGIDYYSCGLYPTEDISRWLSHQLEKNTLPTIIFFNYNILRDTYSDMSGDLTWMFRKTELRYFVSIIKPYKKRILCILCGGSNDSGCFNLYDIPVVLAGGEFPAFCRYDPIKKDFIILFLAENGKWKSPSSRSLEY